MSTTHCVLADAKLYAPANGLRQSGIDEELFDVISGFEALVAPRQQPRQVAINFGSNSS